MMTPTSNASIVQLSPQVRMKMGLREELVTVLSGSNDDIISVVDLNSSSPSYFTVWHLFCAVHLKRFHFLCVPRLIILDGSLKVSHFWHLLELRQGKIVETKVMNLGLNMVAMRSRRTCWVHMREVLDMNMVAKRTHLSLNIWSPNLFKNLSMRLSITLLMQVPLTSTWPKR